MGTGSEVRGTWQVRGILTCFSIVREGRERGESDEEEGIPDDRRNSTEGSMVWGVRGRADRGNQWTNQGQRPRYALLCRLWAHAFHSENSGRRDQSRGIDAFLKGISGGL